MLKNFKGIIIEESLEEHKDNLINSHKTLVSQPNIPKQKEGSSTKAIRNKKKGRSKNLIPKIIGELDLSANPESQKESLKEFFSRKLPKTAFEKNALFVFYLSETLEEKPITIDHIYTCYKAVETKIPTAFKQSLVDTSHKKGWIDTSSIEDISITIAGENLIRELPKIEKMK